jgi:hypothetical protein
VRKRAGAGAQRTLKELGPGPTVGEGLRLSAPPISYISHMKLCALCRCRCMLYVLRACVRGLSSVCCLRRCICMCITHYALRLLLQCTTALATLQASLTCTHLCHLYTWYIHVATATALRLTHALQLQRDDASPRLPPLVLRTLRTDDCATTRPLAVLHTTTLYTLRRRWWEAFQHFYYYICNYSCVLWSVLARPSSTQHTTCAAVPGPRHRSNTTLSISRLLAGQQASRAGHHQGPQLRPWSIWREGRGGGSPRCTSPCSALYIYSMKVHRLQAAAMISLFFCAIDCR